MTWGPVWPTFPLAQCWSLGPAHSWGSAWGKEQNVQSQGGGTLRRPPNMGIEPWPVPHDSLFLKLTSLPPLPLSLPSSWEAIRFFTGSFRNIDSLSGNKFMGHRTVIMTNFY